MGTLARIGALAAVVVIGLAFSACESSKKRPPKLPGEDDANNLAWGRAYPGDPQPGIGGIPQSR